MQVIHTPANRITDPGDGLGPGLFTLIFDCESFTNKKFTFGHFPIFILFLIFFLYY